MQLERRKNMGKIEKVLFWCGISLGAFLVAYVSLMGMPNWIVGVVIPYVAIGGVFVGMRLKTWQRIRMKGGEK